MRFGFQARSGATLALALLLQLALVALALEHSWHRTAAADDATGIEQALAKKHPGARFRAELQPNPALNRIARGLPALTALAFLRAESKLTLASWPATLNHVERSPPSAKTS